MKILIAVVLILVACFFLFAQGHLTKGFFTKIKDDNKTVVRAVSGKTLSYTTVLTMGGVVVMGYLFVLYAKAF
jgi:hypothetical protein